MSCEISVTVQWDSKCATMHTPVTMPNARRFLLYQRGICYMVYARYMHCVCLCVCLSVCLSVSVTIRCPTKRLNGLSRFWRGGFLRPILSCIIRKFRQPQNKGTPLLTVKCKRMTKGKLIKASTECQMLT